MYATLSVPLDLPLHGDIDVAEGAVVRDRDGSILGTVDAAWRTHTSSDLNVRVSLSIEADALFGAGGLTGITLRDAAPEPPPARPSGPAYDDLGHLVVTGEANPPKLVAEDDPLPAPKPSLAGRAAMADPYGNPVDEPST